MASGLMIRYTSISNIKSMLTRACSYHSGDKFLHDDSECRGRETNNEGIVCETFIVYLTSKYIYVLLRSFLCTFIQLPITKRPCKRVLCVTTLFYEALMRWKAGHKEYSEKKCMNYIKVL